MDFKINSKSEKVYDANIEKGFYEDTDALLMLVKKHDPTLLGALRKLIFAQRIALIHSELSEALESNRKDKNFDQKYKEIDWDIMDDENFKEAFELHIKDTEEDELADVQIRTMDLNGANKMDLDFHVRQKLRYNSLRPYKHGKKY